MKKVEMGGTCSTHGGNTKYYKNFVGKTPRKR
jgi:hypothetical protein